jgi:predicted MFS family arabinose efflux permease
MTTPAGERSHALRFIICLGIVSLFADMTYEGARSIVGPFLQDLGATAAQVGLIAGFGEMLAASLRFFSGRMVDRTRAYWTVTILGYFVNVIAVPAMAFAGNWKVAALLIILERTGKGVRGPARDVLLSEATAHVGHGWGFGLHTAMDQTGAVLGPLLMVATVARTQHFAPAFLRLAAPAVCAVIALVVARALYPQAGAATPPRAVHQELPRVFWAYTAAAGLLACGYIDFALMAYHLQKTALAAPATIPLLYAGAMALNGIAALVLGKLFDRFGVAVLSGAILVSLLALPLAFLAGASGVVAGVVCWGIGLGAQDACLRPGIAQVVSMNKRGTAFGAFNGVFGIAWFAGSSAMGLLYQHSVVALVAFGMAAQFAAAVLFFALRRPLRAARS